MSGVALPIPPIPRRRGPFGPATKFLLRRTYAIVGAIAVLGMLPALAGASQPLVAFGLGVAAPGGGFLYTDGPLLAALAAGVFAVSLFVWWLIGNVLLPPLVWLGFAGIAAARAEGGVNEWAEPAAPAILLALLAARLTYYAVDHRVRSARGARYNEEIAAEAPLVSVPAAPARAVAEADPDELPSLRWMLDLALQPVDRLDGFFYLPFDQFREGALRYQFNHIGYTAALFQFAHTPAFTGYLAEAQRNAIAKLLDRRTWRYWAVENLWGNLRWNPDPIIDDNVMYSAYLGLQACLYETMNQDDRYRQRGALTLEWNEDTRYEHDANTVADAVLANLERSRSGLYPCEPNWIYPFCNTFAFNHLIADDRLTGRNRAEPVIERARRAYDEGDYCEPDGRIAGLRSEYLGSRGPGGGNMADAMNAYWLNAIMPDVAQRTWFLVRRHRLGPPGDETRIAHPKWDRVDPGNYNVVDGYVRGALCACATEFGEPELARAFEESLARFRVERDGARRYRRISVWSNFWILLARFGYRDAMRSLIGEGVPDEWKSGPRLAAAAYPDVLVTYAVSDGAGLDLVLRAGAGGGRTTLALERLRPGREYAVRGGVEAGLTAGEDGRATLDVVLDGRIEVRIAPRA